MAELNNAQVVTIKDAIVQVKKWAEEKNYEQVKQGCEEILAVEPDNLEVKTLLETANKALAPQTPAPVATVTPAPVAAPAPVTPFAPITPMDIFKKPSEPVTPVKPLEKVKIEDKSVKKTSEKNGLAGKIITLVVFLGLLGGFIYSFIQGWLNPFYDWILGLFGL